MNDECLTCDGSGLVPVPSGERALVGCPECNEFAPVAPTIPDAAIEVLASKLYERCMSERFLQAPKPFKWADCPGPDGWRETAAEWLRDLAPHLIGPFAAANTGLDDVAKAVALSDVIRAVPDDDLDGDVAWKLTAAIVKAGPFVMEDEAEVIADAVLASGHVVPADEAVCSCGDTYREKFLRVGQANMDLLNEAEDDLEQLRRDVRAVVDDPTVLTAQLRDRVRAAIGGDA